MSEEEDYSLLPLEDRAIHKVWKVRLAAYEELIDLFRKSSNEQDPNFLKYGQPDLFKKIVTDSNVVAQETGVNCLCRILEFGGSKMASRLKNIITPLCEKSFVSSRAGTKQKATDLLMFFIELLDSADQVIELMLPFFSHKIPKVIAAATKSLTEIVALFGCQVCSPKQIIPVIPKLFAHADKNVRLEATNLSVELYKWLRSLFEDLVFADLKPVQQKDLKALFDKVGDEKPQQTRLLKSQQEQELSGDADGDVEMNGLESLEDGNALNAGPVLDAYDLAPAVDVLSKLPSDFYDQIASVKWSERKEALESFHKHLNVLKMEDGNFTDLMRCLSKCISKDANIQVVTVAANCVDSIAKGLRSKFEKYIPMVLPALLERTKEKKLTVAELLANALDAVFGSSDFSHFVEDITKYLAHKTPQVKIATAQFLARCLQKTKFVPTKLEIETFLPPLVKLLSDSQEPVRSALSEAIGTLMKITGERELNSYLAKVDENRLAKVKQFCEDATVVAKKQAAKPQKPAVSSAAAPGPAAKPRVGSIRAPSNAGTPRLSQLGTLKPSIPPPSSNRQLLTKKTLPNSIPSKRIATSPLKNDFGKPTLARLSNIGRTLNSNTLTNSNSPALVQDEMSSNDKLELETLRQEKLNWLKEKEHLQWKIKDSSTREERLMKEISSLQFKSEMAMEEHTKDIINLKSKDTQLSRLQNDLEIARNKIHVLETEKQQLLQLRSQRESQQLHAPSKLLQPQQSALMLDSDRIISPVRSTYISPFEEPNMSSDLSMKVKRLSIDNGDKENSSPQLDFSRSKVDIDLDNNDDSWRRAAEVTSQLKARIEKMKARSRSNVSNFGSR